ncbi:predicted protein [Arabidopsis lyrata subsp. lyrata]|uniref:Predicted protein n=1 Tax=Arabidopsis lyrata subsp. lyrata TaxID=81972 RepID=D7MB31_ARALL|nr:predicted protein [Arabidopsis lyrata subsp. lyrata]
MACSFDHIGQKATSYLFSKFGPSNGGKCLGLTRKNVNQRSTYESALPRVSPSIAETLSNLGASSSVSATTSLSSIQLYINISNRVNRHRQRGIMILERLSSDDGDGDRGSRRLRTWLCFYREVVFFIEASLRRAAAIDDGDGLRFRWRLKGLD